MATIKTRVTRLEEMKAVREEEETPPPGMTPMQHYLWLINRPVKPVPFQDRDITPEEAAEVYRRLIVE